MNPPTIILLLDNTVLSNFALVEQTELLSQALPDNASTVPQVIEEFTVGVSLGRLPPTDLDWLDVVYLDAVETALLEQHLVRVNAGEAACLAVAHCRNGRILTDDRDARKLAAQLNVPVSGTLGILVRLVETNALKLNLANSILLAMIARGYRSPVERLDDLQA